ncbi:ArsR/SmtB family transcription factor [Martelella endophytica]|uniref:ArsR/SmtB family transcription factor n=1 Tax=Martelella endophytica TaxID=1486262 RepID=UPI0005F13886|nr:metalloregulator ArsR/SmtB family transcription factor [Martelella endophytica]
MDDSLTIAALGALAQPTRLQCFRLLISREPEPVAAGELARALGVPQNTMSAHLSIMSNAGLLTSERQGRSILYRADLEGFRRLVMYLLEDCCGGNAGLCAPLIDALTAGCQPAQENDECRCSNAT